MQVIGDIIRLNAKRYPDKIALMMDHGNLTFKKKGLRGNSITKLVRN